MMRPVCRYSAAEALFDFNPEAWVELAYPAEERVSIMRGGVREVIPARFTEAGFSAMVEKFRAAKEANPAHSLLVNIDHLAFQQDQKTEAAAWLVDLKVEGGRLFGLFKWSSLGETLARGGVYRFVSVEVSNDTTPPETWAAAGAEWNVLQGVAITNVPKLEKLSPFAHRKDGQDGQPIEENKPKGKPKMETIIAALGLAPEATPEMIVEAINAMKEKIAAADAAEMAAKEEKAAAEMRAKEEAFAAKYAARFTTPEACVAFFRAAPDSAEAMAETIVVPAPVKKDEPKPITHRKGGTPEDGGDSQPVTLAHYRALEGKARREYLAKHKAELIRLERAER